MKHLYYDLMNEADKVYILKGADGFKLRKMIKQLGMLFIERHFNVDFFFEPYFEQSVEAIYIKNPKKILILQGTSPSIEPIQIGFRDFVIPLYDCIDLEKIDEKKLRDVTKKEENVRQQLFQTINKGLVIHDDWEVETQKGMNWDNLNKHVEVFIKNIFSHIQLNKRGEITHRLLGTLTPNGAKDTLESITKHLHKRVFIKGYPGTGKSTLMKKVANVALSRGFDVQYVWCGLDSRGIDMVIVPELSFCIFDSTLPHEYFPDPSRKGDEIFDIVQYCNLTEEAKRKLENIISDYKKTMKEAKVYAKEYANFILQKREIIDAAINDTEWKKRTAELFKLI